MPDGGDAMALYGVGAAWKATGAGGTVSRADGTVTGAVEVVIGAAAEGAMTVGEDVPLTVTAVLRWHAPGAGKKKMDYMAYYIQMFGINGIRETTAAVELGTWFDPEIVNKRASGYMPIWRNL